MSAGLIASFRFDLRAVLLQDLLERARLRHPCRHSGHGYHVERLVLGQPLVVGQDRRVDAGP